MALDLTDVTIGSPEWWLVKLSAALDARQPDLQKYDDYYAGDQRIQFQSARFRNAFGGLFTDFSDNWCELVVDATEERLNVEGFRFGDERGDADAWRIWQANQLDGDSQLAHTEALKSGYCYALVTPNGEIPTITVESPREVIVAHAAGNRRTRTAALKRWIEDDGHLCATVYLPGQVYKYRSEKQTDPVSGSNVQWVERTAKGETWPLKNPLGVVPMVPLLNKPRLDGSGVSEIDRVIPMQDAINKELIDMLVASEYAAFKQRWVAGIEVSLDDEGNPIAPFDVGVDKLLVATKSDTNFGEFSETNLTNYVKVVEMLVQHVASQTRTPPHYFYLSGQFPSGESIKSAETGLVAKARRKMRHFGEAWEEVIRLAFKAQDNSDPRANVLDAETIWGDPESRSESEHVDATLKKQALGVPQEQLWEDLGYSPSQIARFKAMQATDSLEALFAQPDVVAR